MNDNVIHLKDLVTKKLYRDNSKKPVLSEDQENYAGNFYHTYDMMPKLTFVEDGLKVFFDLDMAFFSEEPFKYGLVIHHSALIFNSIYYGRTFATWGDFLTVWMSIYAEQQDAIASDEYCFDFEKFCGNHNLRIAKDKTNLGVEIYKNTHTQIASMAYDAGLSKGVIEVVEDAYLNDWMTKQMVYFTLESICRKVSGFDGEHLLIPAFNALVERLNNFDMADEQ